MISWQREATGRRAEVLANCRYTQSIIPLLCYVKENVFGQVAMNTQQHTHTHLGHHLAWNKTGSAEGKGSEKGTREERERQVKIGPLQVTVSRHKHQSQSRRLTRHIHFLSSFFLCFSSSASLSSPPHSASLWRRAADASAVLTLFPSRPCSVCPSHLDLYRQFI